MRVAVIGAGVQGIGVALELAARGVPVVLHERRDRVHARASLANEGKVHLGYTYAHDTSLRTARQMVEGAWSFAPIVSRWLGRDIDDQLRSRPFTYLVHRESLLDPDALEVVYDRIAALNAELAARPGTRYFGLDAARPLRRIATADRAARFGPDVTAAFESSEVAVDSRALGHALAKRLVEEPAIDLRLDSEVLAAEPGADGVRLTTRQDGATETVRYDHVVNASWEDLLRIDATAGVEAPPGSSFRWRQALRLHRPGGGRDLEPCSVVLGPFGDVVRFPDGDLWLSWYPVGRRGMVTSLSPPPAWSDEPSPEDAEDVRWGTFAALRDLIPALDAIAKVDVASATVHAGIVYARGTTDIHDPGSGFHERHAIGPRSYGSYHTIDTGKYTTAPLFARRIAERVASASVR
jgi:glycine/D-amino acid oxidase-like deaminating enzyme